MAVRLTSKMAVRFAGGEGYVKAIILAAGKGTRLRPLTDTVSKHMLPVNGVPIIDWVIANLKTCREVDEIIVAVAGNDDSISQMHAESIERHLSEKYHGSIRTVRTRQKETAGDLRKVLEEYGLETGPVLIAYGDSFTDLSVPNLVEYHRQCRKSLGISATVALFEVREREAKRLGVANVYRKGGFTLIDKFVEKPEHPESRLASAAIYVLELDDVYGRIAAEGKVEHTLFPYLAPLGKLAGCKEKVSYWIDIGTQQSYEEANKFARENRITPPLLPGVSRV